jgi:hypothetical protein
MLVETPTLDFASKIVQIIGWSGVISGLIWFIRAYDKGTTELKNINDNCTESRRLTMETLGITTQTRDNHMVHLAQDMHEQKQKQDKTIEVIADQTKILMSIDKGIAILADRQSRS